MRQIHGENKTNKDQTTQRRHANLPARFAFRQQRKQRTNTKKRPEPHQKSPHQDLQDCLRHDRDKPTVSPKYPQNELASLWPEQKGVKSCATAKSSNKIARDESLCREMSPFFSVQPHMALARSLSKPESQLHIYKFSELKQWQNHHIDKVHQK